MQTSNSSQNKRHKQEFYGSKLSQCLCDDFAKGKCLDPSYETFHSTATILCIMANVISVGHS